MQDHSAQPSGLRKTSVKLAFASIGVVFGDIGTSPLYAMREALHPVVEAGGDLRAAVLGVASLLIWALILIVTLKYVVFLMRADNKGEGGILSLVVLIETLLKKKGGIVLALGIIGAAFFFGDAMITPAMSVLSAVEGLKVVNEGFAPYVVPLTLAILITLFLFQYKGTAGVASLFAPVTVIASQAVITGAFSIAQQAMSLGLFPRMGITHTSETEHGQIYVGQINWMILVGVVILVLVFQSSSNLASAYGIAVNTSMIVDTILAAIFFWKSRSLPVFFVIPALAVIFVIEATFLAANGLKLAHGGYMPVLLGATIILLMVTWMRGRRALSDKLRKESVELVPLLESLERRQPTRVAGAAVFLQTDPIYAPSALMHNLKHNRVLHDRLVFITAETTSQPRLEGEDRVKVKQLPLGAWLVEARFGYMEQPDVPKALRACAEFGLEIDPRHASYFLGRRVIRMSARSSMPFWQQRLFIMMANQSSRAIEFFRIPPDRVVELGMQMSV